MGQLDNTLIIYISGDNGASAEGMVNGTPNEFTTFNGIEVPVKDQFLWYEFWGSDGPSRTTRRRGPGPSTRRSNG
jgi:arylsulfatase A-like enzyme